MPMKLFQMDSRACTAWQKSNTYVKFFESTSVLESIFYFLSLLIIFSSLGSVVPILGYYLGLTLHLLGVVVHFYGKFIERMDGI